MAGTLTVDTIQSDSSYASTLNVASKMNFAAGMQIGGQDTTFGGMRNRIINGDMRINQRAYSATPTSDMTYTVDRWAARLSQSSKFSVSQSSTAPTGFTNSLLATSLSAYAVGASDYFALQHIIEGFNTADLGWGTSSGLSVTLSFWVRSSLTGTFGGQIFNDNNGVTSGYTFSYTINSANTFEYKTITIPAPPNGTTWGTTNSYGINVFFSLGCGSTFTGTPNSWITSFKGNPTGGVNLVGTNAATFYITGVQLEKGSAATAFENRQYGQELALCQRYYEIGGNNAPTQVEGGGTNVWISIQYKVNKRATPTIGLTSASNLALRYYGTAGYAITGAAYVTGYISATSAMVRYSGFSSLTTSASMFTSGTADATPNVDPFSISAEL